MRSVHARCRRGPGSEVRAMVVGDGCAERMRHALLDRNRRLRARTGRAARQERRERQALSSVPLPDRARLGEGPLIPMTEDDPRAVTESLKVDTLQRDLLIPQIQAFVDATSDTAARNTYLALKSAVESMEVAPEHQARLGAIVEVALQSGRIRRLFGP